MPERPLLQSAAIAGEGTKQLSLRGLARPILLLRRFPSTICGLALLILGAFPSVPHALPPQFPKPSALEPQVEFWKKIFAVYGENQAVLHDSVRLDKVYSVLDLPRISPEGADLVTLKLRKQRVEAEKARIDMVLGRLDGVTSPAGLDPEARKVWDLFADVPGGGKFAAARERVRMQLGLRENFERGLEVSRSYLPHMEEIFRREGLPVKLTRLPLIESTFNLKAYSKKAAAGIWQFIPSSARLYRLRLNSVVDDRRDPLYATQAAARHLRDDYEMLGSWPLAITAYNHGRAGVVRAVRQTGSSEIDDIVREYHGSAFGFASRNFYAEFVAALEVESASKQYFPDLRPHAKLVFDEVQIDQYVPFRALAKAAGCDVDELRGLNPAFHSEVVEGRLHVPRGYRLRVPSGSASAFRTAYAKIDPGERRSQQQTFYATHRVTRGQTLGSIARRYGTSVRALQALNKMRGTRLATGRSLKIPGGAAITTAMRAEPSSRRGSAELASRRGSAKASRLRTHRVRRGLSLGAIARRYGTTVRALRSHNGLRGDQVRAGQVLRIPSS
ncbi:MAG: rane-bound lytic murein transglycosylase [Candidatus Binatota bacterium]|nr:rane-bound lytic murein transglycosylase [Candidatus Binatota bacterium]